MSLLHILKWIQQGYREEWTIDDVIKMGDKFSYIVFSISRVAGSIFTAPVSRIETAMQVGRTGLQEILPSAPNQPQEEQVRTISKTVGTIFQTQGFFALWRGLRATILYKSLQAPLQWYITKFGRSIRKSLPKKFTGYASVITVGHLVTQAILYPIEVIRVKAASDLSPEREHRTITGTINKIINEDGFFSLFSGIVPNLLGTVLIEGLGNIIATKLITLFKVEDSNWKVALLGTIGTLSAAAIGYPWIVISRTMAAQVGGPNPQSENAIECAADIYSKHGISGFYGGFQITAFSIIQNKVKGIFLSHSFEKKAPEVKKEQVVKKRGIFRHKKASKLLFDER